MQKTSIPIDAAVGSSSDKPEFEVPLWLILAAVLAWIVILFAVISVVA